MRVIDLLNKIANGEEVPKEIKVDDKYYCYDETDIAEFYRYRGILGDELLTDYTNLNDEVEIIEEDKKIDYEDIKEIKCVGCNIEINISGAETLFATDERIVTEHCIYKINQLIKNQKKLINEINKLKKNKSRR